MNYTEKLKLRKPEGGEYYSVEDFNGNADLIDSAITGKISKPAEYAAGNLASISVSGNIEDSGKKPADFADAVHNHDVAYAPINHSNNGDIHVNTNEKAAIGFIKNKADRSYVDAQLNGKATASQTSTKIYVSKIGNDSSGDGSMDKPYLSIMRAVRDIPCFIRGNFEILIGNGTYSEDVYIGDVCGGRLWIKPQSEGKVSVKSIVAQCVSYIGVDQIDIYGISEESNGYASTLKMSSCGTVLLYALTCISSRSAFNHGAFRFEYCPCVIVGGYDADRPTIISNKDAAIDAMASNVYLNWVAGTNNTVAIRSGSGFGGGGAAVYKGDYTTIIEGTCTEAFGGQIWPQ